MYIQPNTTIRIIKNCPLDIDYANTIYFTSVSQQTNFFLNTLDGYTLQNNTYQRVEKGKMRVQMNAEALYNCNYLAFQNASFGSKWFYAFITGVEYINNVTSEISYVLDIMQTWHFNYVMMDCFVEREHSVTDEIGDNLVPESFDTGDYISDDFIMPSELNDYKIVFWCTFDANYDNVGGTFISNGYKTTYSGLNPTAFPLTAQGISDAINWLGDVPVLKQSGVVNAVICPTIANNALETNINISKKETMLRNDGTNVKNKKCLTYPYNYLYVTNNSGQSCIFRYEFFSNSNCELSLFADYSPKSECILYPKNYKGVSVNFDEKISIGGFPPVGYNIDAYKAWLAQMASSIGTNFALAGMALGEATPAVTAASTYACNATALTAYGAAGPLVNPNLGWISGMGAAAGAAIPIALLAMQSISGTIHAFMPPQARGQQGGNVNLSRGILNFGIMHKHITPEFASIIDDYFSVYGYATNRIKRPNRNARPEWNYVKTIGCKIDPDSTAGLPADDAKAIEDVYNKGITFWNNPAHIGNYSYDNSPTI